ncbi:hypothetical protein PIB30_031875 [Stylosanthes scabra]|uniref:Uncharacterized protein n=1 Tax=Stylosanthes scabra TaxID=79078 RepID=A0ABU6VDA5_9FABA|nr:hypothetical protein [Stylosanthes scabra]
MLRGWFFLILPVVAWCTPAVVCGYDYAMLGNVNAGWIWAYFGTVYPQTVGGKVRGLEGDETKAQKEVVAAVRHGVGEIDDGYLGLDPTSGNDRENVKPLEEQKPQLFLGRVPVGNNVKEEVLVHGDGTVTGMPCSAGPSTSPSQGWSSGDEEGAFVPRVMDAIEALEGRVSQMEMDK